MSRRHRGEPIATRFRELGTTRPENSAGVGGSHFEGLDDGRTVAFERFDCHFQLFREGNLPIKRNPVELDLAIWLLRPLLHYRREVAGQELTRANVEYRLLVVLGSHHFGLFGGDDLIDINA